MDLPPFTPVTSRSTFLRYRKRSSPHPIMVLSKKEKDGRNSDKLADTTTSSTEAETSVARESHLISDDSGIDVSEDLEPGEGRYFLRKKYKDPF